MKILILAGFCNYPSKIVYKKYKILDNIFKENFNIKNYQSAKLSLYEKKMKQVSLLKSLVVNMVFYKWRDIYGDEW